MECSEAVPSRGVVKLNVGGKRFSTTCSTLLSHGQSFFAGLLSPRFEAPEDAAGEIFIDRDGSLFGHVLSFMRTCDANEVVELEEEEVRVRSLGMEERQCEELLVRRLLRIAREAEYYGVEGLRKYLLEEVDRRRRAWKDEQALHDGLRWDGFYIRTCNLSTKDASRSSKIKEGDEKSESVEAMIMNYFATSQITWKEREKLLKGLSIRESTTVNRELSEALTFRRNGTMLVARGIDAEHAIRMAVAVYDVPQLWSECEPIKDMYAKYFLKSFSRGRYWWDGESLKLLWAKDRTSGALVMNGGKLVVLHHDEVRTFQFVPWSEHARVLLWRPRERVSARECLVARNAGGAGASTEDVSDTVTDDYTHDAADEEGDE